LGGEREYFAGFLGLRKKGWSSSPGRALLGETPVCRGGRIFLKEKTHEKKIQGWKKRSDRPLGREKKKKRQPENVLKLFETKTGCSHSKKGLYTLADRKDPKRKRKEKKKTSSGEKGKSRRERGPRIVRVRLRRVHNQKRKEAKRRQASVLCWGGQPGKGRKWR